MCWWVLISHWHMLLKYIHTEWIHNLVPFVASVLTQAFKKNGSFWLFFVWVIIISEPFYLLDRVKKTVYFPILLSSLFIVFRATFGKCWYSTLWQPNNCPLFGDRNIHQLTIMKKAALVLQFKNSKNENYHRVFWLELQRK